MFAVFAAAIEKPDLLTCLDRLVTKMKQRSFLKDINSIITISHQDS
jgi:hypothetical protein